MTEKALRVGVLMGGLSTERPISMKSGKAVCEALRNRGWNAIDIVVDRDLPAKLLDNQIDVAWIALHGRFGEDGCVQGLLEVMGIPYTGCGVLASSVAMDKIATKRALAGDSAVVMARDWVYRKGAAWPSDITLPAVVKPSIGGSTIGIAIARTETELRDALDEAFRLNNEVLIEEFVEGDEITVAVLDGRPLPVVRILPHDGFFDFEAKYTEGKTTYEVPADISESAWHSAQLAAKHAFVRLGCRGLCRADFIVRRGDDQPVFLEINTIPGMTATSLSPMSAAQEGISFEELCERILKAATVMEAEIETA